MYIKIRKSKPLCSFSFTYVLFFLIVSHCSSNNATNALLLESLQMKYYGYWILPNE